MDQVQVIRTAVNEQLFVTSGVRCAKYNKTVGGVEDSEHIPIKDIIVIHSRPGEGIDIACLNSELRWKLVGLGMIIFNRVGVGDGFVHFGVRPDKPQEVLWDYY